jgi:hypothetical protein
MFTWEPVVLTPLPLPGTVLTGEVWVQPACCTSATV